MNSMLGRYAAFVMVAAVQIGSATLAHGQAATAPRAAGVPPQSRDDSTEGPNDATAAPVDLPVLYVTSVEILQTATEPKMDVVSVTGLVASEGWDSPQLVPTYAGKPYDDVLDLQFIASAPVQSQLASGFVVVTADFPLDPDHRFKGVRVRAAENAISVLQVPGSNQNTSQVNGCKDCLGKRFAPAGQAQPGEQGVVRQEDLPRDLRVIRPSDGIRGADQDPDRLTLITDDKGIIVGAFWE
ncbi:MAG TPA: hypothetical protein VGI78_06555 [Acetobacteraceae bacterium]|jgi:hypothetical protein